MGCPASVIGPIGADDRVIAVSKEMLNEEDLEGLRYGEKLIIKDFLYAAICCMITENFIMRYQKVGGFQTLSK